MNESIVLDLSSGLTKADDTAAESFVNHLDIFIFKAVQSGSDYTHGERVYYGRYSVNNSSSVTLDAKRSSYSETDRYFVYLVANATHTQADMEGIATYNDLQNVKQEDAYLHITALNAPNAPKYFLMDAIAKDASDNSPVLLYNGVPSDNTVLEAELRRAAAKVVVNITAGSDVRFNHFTLSDGSADPESEGVYYIRNLPYDTYLLAGVDASLIEAQRKTTMPGFANEYFKWNPNTSDDKVSLTTYVYPHHWVNESILTDETCVIMNLPMVFKPGTADETPYKNSWYKIPMSKDQKFERNRYYEVNITLNRPGAISDSNPQVLTDIYYSVEDWTEVSVDVGKDENKPQYLQLSADHVDMYNVNTDDSALQFASSSNITSITLLEAYYLNSTDTRVNLQSSDSNDKNVYSQIEATFTPDVLNGTIAIFSPFVKEDGLVSADCHKNTIRFMTFEVRNADGQVARFTVAQYPTLYITNEHGRYSYREDFTGSTSGVSWSGGNWVYTNNASSGSFFASKVAAGSAGSYSIRYANWNNGSYTASGSLGMFNNPRMYHIHITATSKDYIIAKPNLDSNGYTEMTSENSRLVSPSFLIASQLGATETSGGGSTLDMQKAIRHCKEYMEVTEDGKVYKDWRIPTKAEIDIIQKHQHTSPAMAEVLNGSHYYCAYNPEYEQYTNPSNPYYSQRRNWIYTVRDIGSSGSVHVRCVHDAYGETE